MARSAQRLPIARFHRIITQRREVHPVGRFMALRGLQHLRRWRHFMGNAHPTRRLQEGVTLGQVKSCLGCPDQDRLVDVSRLEQNARFYRDQRPCDRILGSMAVCSLKGYSIPSMISPKGQASTCPEVAGSPKL